MPNDISPSHIDEIVQHVQLLQSESPVYCSVPFDPDYTASVLLSGIEAGVFFGAIDYYGFMLAARSNQWYDPRVFAYEQCLFVWPKYRGTWKAIKLIKHVEDQVKSRNITRLYVGASTGISDERVEKLYEALGYKWEGRNLLKELINV